MRSLKVVLVSAMLVAGAYPTACLAEQINLQCSETGATRVVTFDTLSNRASLGDDTVVDNVDVTSDTVTISGKGPEVEKQMSNHSYTRYFKRVFTVSRITGDARMRSQYCSWDTYKSGRNSDVKCDSGDTTPFRCVKFEGRAF